MRSDQVFLVERMKDTLRSVMARRTYDFSGIGLIVSNSPEKLPIVPLSKSEPNFEKSDLVSQLVAIASRSSAYHDGFHIISQTWQLTGVAQYFSPPVADDAVIDRSKRFGGRYLAALFGSSIPAVSLSGIASEDFGIAVFERGREVFFEEHE
ncbi:hypothetical protein ACVIGB_008337 [Bradyrhizobium sp. USDA 4341]